MPFSPSEILKHQGDSAATEIAAHIERIDRGMVGRYRGGIYTHQAPADPVVEREIVRVYEAKGWSIRRVSDQRDGDYLEFKAK